MIEVRAVVGGDDGTAETDSEWELDAALVLCHLQQQKLVALMEFFGSGGYIVQL